MEICRTKINRANFVTLCDRRNENDSARAMIFSNFQFTNYLLLLPNYILYYLLVLLITRTSITYLAEKNIFDEHKNKLIWFQNCMNKVQSNIHLKPPKKSFNDHNQWTNAFLQYAHSVFSVTHFYSISASSNKLMNIKAKCHRNTGQENQQNEQTYLKI